MMLFRLSEPWSFRYSRRISADPKHHGGSCSEGPAAGSDPFALLSDVGLDFIGFAIGELSDLLGLDFFG